MSHVYLSVLNTLGNWRAIQIILRSTASGWPAEIATWALLTQCHLCRHLHCALTRDTEQSWLLITGENVKSSKWFKSFEWLLEAVGYKQVMLLFPLKCFCCGAQLTFAFGNFQASRHCCIIHLHCWNAFSFVPADPLSIRKWGKTVIINLLKHEFRVVILFPEET